jgi:hypothetical protein
MSRRNWKQKNKLAMIFMWSRIEPEWQHLVLGETSGCVAFTKLKKQFEASNFSHCITLHTAFYRAVHDTSQPVEIFIHFVIDIKSQVEAIGVKVDDDALKDVILMNLDDSFSSIWTSLLSLPLKPSFDMIHCVLTSSAPIVHADAVKSEELAMAVKFKRSGGRKERRRSSGHEDSLENWRDHLEGGGIKV